MSCSSKKLPKFILRLVFLLSKNFNEKNFENKDILNQFILAFDNLNIKSIPHSHLIESLKRNLVLNEMKKPNLYLSKIEKRIPFKSSINPNNLSKIVNLSIFNNMNSSINYFNKYEKEKNEIIQNRKNKIQENSNINNYNNKNNNNKNKTNNLYNNPNSALNKNFFGGGGSYMDTKPVYAKKKSNQLNLEENEEEENTISYSSYTNGIYNINRKKKKRNTYDEEEYEEENNNYYNKYQNKKKRNNKYKSNNIDEDEEEFNEYDKKLRQCTGFQSAITITNAVMKNNKISESYIKNLEESENIENKENENTIISRKKFIPPLKTNSTNKGCNNNTKRINKTGNNNNKEDEKLKGIDENLISFIESEILTKSPNVSWDDIAGLDFAKKTIKEIIIWPLLRPDLFNGIRRPPKGLLLFGPPGTGKTMIAKAIASQSKSQFFNISASSLLSKWIGESEKLVRTLFTLASLNQPSVIFIDEIDSILTSRSENENESSRRIKTEFLVQLDGAGTNIDDRILIIGATNRPQEIDDAFVRRLSKRLYIPLPNKVSRKMLIETVIEKEKKMGNKYNVNNDEIDIIVNKTKGYSGSDLINVCKEAAMMPIRNIDDICNFQPGELREVNYHDFEESLNNVKKSVSEKTIEQYVLWNKEFGSFQFEDKDE